MVLGEVRASGRRVRRRRAGGVGFSLMLALALGAPGAPSGAAGERGPELRGELSAPAGAATPAGRAGRAPAARASDSAAAATALRVATYNIHSGLGPSWAPFRSRATVEAHLAGIVEDVVAVTGPSAPVDVLALNEVDFRSRRSAWIDQAAWIARALELRTGHAFAVVRGPTWTRDLPGFEVEFGNALLVRHPVLAAEACLLDEGVDCAGAAPADGLPPLRASDFWSRKLREVRGVVRATIEVDGEPIDVLATHLDAFALPEREAQAAHLLRRFLRADRTTVLAGDMNAVPAPMTPLRRLFAGDRTHDILTSGPLGDARDVFATGAAASGAAATSAWATYPAAEPRWPLDWILASPDLLPERVAVVGGRHSDHRALFVRYERVSDPRRVASLRAAHDARRRERLERILAGAGPGAAPAAAAIAAAPATIVAWLGKATRYLEVAPPDLRESLTVASGDLQPSLAP